MDIGKKIIRGFGLALSILVVIALVSGLNSYNLQKNTYWVTHTHQVLADLESLLSELQDTEIGQRGYLLTSNKSYLDPYNDALNAIPIVIVELQQRTADNKDQQERIGDVSKLTPNHQNPHSDMQYGEKNLVDLIVAKLAELKQTIDLHDAGTPDEALALVKSDEGKKIMDDMRGVVREMTNAEETLLESRESAASFWATLTYVFTILGTIVAVVAVSITGRQVSRSVTRDFSERQQLSANFEGQVAAINKTQAVIEFELDGTIITANDNFLDAMGYSLDEIQGKHHSIFVTTEFRQSAEYRTFWEQLNRGKHQAGEFNRIGKGGREVRLLASYTPILIDGQPVKVVKFATDITEQTLRNADFEGQIAAINRTQAVIEFNMDGTIITANDSFLSAIGYTLGECEGKHHSMFVDPEYARSAEYHEFWERLNRGEHQAGEFQRIGKGGQAVWLQASSTPILIDGQPVKVVKYATDVSDQKRAVAQIAETAAAVAEGDLTQQELKESSDDMGQIATALNKMVGSLKELLRQNQELTSQLSTATQEINTSSQQQLASLNESVTSLNQISSTAEEFKTTIQEFADRARSVQEASGETAKQASEGRTLAQQSAQQAEAVRDDARAAGETVLQFADQMQRITDITDTVNEIAEQTKLLALNASIEAARAGEEGKGFAVVATQVRELANQSKAAAGNISTLIGDTQRSLQSVVDRIEQGSRQSDETATMVKTMADQFDEMVAAFAQTADAMTQIAGGAQQQEEGITELVAGLTEVESASKETSASAEQTQKSITEIDQQIGTLNETMQRFKV